MTSLRDCAGPYRLLEEIGVGGMGEVHLALDDDGRTVAVKVLHPAVARDEVARRRLGREVATMRRVHSPYVAEVIDADFTAKRPYIVTRYVQGRSLHTKVRAGGPLRGGALRRTSRGLARALYAIHEAGIVHRDLKPANVVMVEENPVVIDFGLAHVLDSTRLTRTGAVIGTPGYLAPEILDGGRATPAADVFSWGATVAFSATGRSPFGSGPAQAVFSRVLRGRFELTGVPGDLLPIVEAALAVEPEDRPDSVDVLEELATAHARRRSAAPPRGPAPVPPRPAPRAEPEPDPVEEIEEEFEEPYEDVPEEPACDPPPGPGLLVLLRACVAMAVPVACYVLPVIAVVVTLSGCAAAYTWDAMAGAWRRASAAHGGRSRAGAALAAVVTVPLRTALRLTVLLLALVAGYAGVLTATWWFVHPHARALALPFGVLALTAVLVRAWYASEYRAARLAVWMVAAALLAGAIAGVPYPAWWPLVLS